MNNKQLLPGPLQTLASPPTISFPRPLPLLALAVAATPSRSKTGVRESVPRWQKANALVPDLKMG